MSLSNLHTTLCILTVATISCGIYVITLSIPQGQGMSVSNPAMSSFSEREPLKKMSSNTDMPVNTAILPKIDKKTHAMIHLPH